MGDTLAPNDTNAQRYEDRLSVVFARGSARRATHNAFPIRVASTSTSTPASGSMTPHGIAASRHPSSVVRRTASTSATPAAYHARTHTHQQRGQHLIASSHPTASSSSIHNPRSQHNPRGFLHALVPTLVRQLRKQPERGGATRAFAIRSGGSAIIPLSERNEWGAIVDEIVQDHAGSPSFAGWLVVCALGGSSHDLNRQYGVVVGTPGIEGCYVLETTTSPSIGCASTQYAMCPAATYADGSRMPLSHQIDAAWLAPRHGRPLPIT